MSNALEPLTPEHPEPQTPLPAPQVLSPKTFQPAPTPTPQPAESVGGFQDQMLPPETSSTGGEALHTGELEGGVTSGGWDTFVRRLKASSGESGGISSIGTFLGGEGGATARMAEEEYLRLTKTQDDPLIDPKTLTETYGIPFTEPEFGDVAALRAASVMRQRELQEAISRGPQAGHLQNLGIGMATMLTDPLSMAVMAVSGGVGGALGAGELAGVGKLATTGAENLVVGGALAVPHYIQENVEGNPVTVGQEMGGALEGALYGTALHYGVFKPLGFALEKTKPLAQRMTSAMKEKLIMQTVAQHEMGMQTDTSNVEGAQAARNAGLNPPGIPQQPYEFNPEAKPQGRVFYEAISGDTGASVPLQDIGGGRDLTDNGSRANHLISDPEGNRSGDVRAIRIPEDAKLLTVDDPTKEVVAKAKEDGYDGVHYVEDMGGKSSHILNLFDDKFGPEETFLSNPDITPKLPNYQIPEKFDPEKSINASPEVDQTLKKYSEAKPIQNDVEQLSSHLKAQELENLKKLEKYAENMPDVKEALEAMRESNTADTKEVAAIKEAAKCLEGEWE